MLNSGNSTSPALLKLACWQLDACSTLKDLILCGKCTGGLNPCIPCRSVWAAGVPRATRSRL